MTIPFVSIIVPVYGVEQYIAKCGRSLMEQTLQDVEYVFVDDCTPDNSMEILQQVLGDYPHRKAQVKILHNETNQGAAQSRRNGMTVCTGEYVICVDSDDYVAPDYCEKLYAKAAQEQADIVWCDFYKQQGEKWNVIKQLPAGKLSIDSEIKSLLLGRRQGALWNHLIRRDLYYAITYFPTHNMAEDLTVLLQMYTAAHRLAYVAAPLYYYRYNEVSLSHADGAERDGRVIRQMKDMEANANLLERFFRERGLLQRFHSELVFRKFFNKRWVLPALHSSHDCNLWRHCHADINASFYLNRYISLHDKLISLLVQSGLYPYVRRFFRHSSAGLGVRLLLVCDSVLMLISYN